LGAPRRVIAAAAARAWYLALMVMRSRDAKYNCDEEKEKIMTKPS
jgi:hypothetical protein